MPVEAMKRAVALLSIFVTLPIWYYLLYKILVLVNATELMWFLYAVYIPAQFLVSCLTRLISK